VTNEEEYFPPPRQLRDLVDAVSEALRVTLGAAGDVPSANDRAIDASDVLASLEATA
jgi:4-hydroxy-3-methylbut-2-enyl diphosphate reductase